MKRRAEKGQALTELVIVLPLFLVLLSAAAFWAHLMLARLSLIALTRDYTLLLARNESSLHASDAERTQTLRRLAARITALDPQHLSQRLEPVSLSLTQGQDAGTGQALQDPGIGQLLQSLLLGQRLWVVYELHFGGLAGRLFPHGLTLKETVAFKGDPWKNPAQRLMNLLQPGLDRLLRP